MAAETRSDQEVSPCHDRGDAFCSYAGPCHDYPRWRDGDMTAGTHQFWTLDRAMTAQGAGRRHGHTCNTLIIKHHLI